MTTPKTPAVAKTVNKAFTGGQVSPTGSTMLPKEQHTNPPAGIKAPSSADQKSSLQKSVSRTPHRAKLY